MFVLSHLKNAPLHHVDIINPFTSSVGLNIHESHFQSKVGQSPQC
jgi:hypothetical protein